MRHFVSYFNDSVKKHWNLPAVTNFGKQTYTYGQVAENIAKYHIIFKETGIKKGDKVALYARNSAEWVIAYYATLTYGAVTVPFLPDFLPAAVAELSAFSECRMLIADEYAINAFKADEACYLKMEQTKGFAGVIDIKGFLPVRSTDKNFETACEGIDRLFQAQYPSGMTPADVNYYNDSFGMEDAVEISFTSGTTSATSKGVVLPARSLSANLEFGFGIESNCAGKNVFAILPMAHMFGQAFDVMFPLSSGCHLFVMPGKPTPARLIGGMGTVKPFFFLTVPLVIEKIFKSKVFPITRKYPAKLLLKIPLLDRIVLSKIRKSLLAAFGDSFTVGVIIGGAALNREVEDLLKRMNFPYVVGYGMTEAAPLLAYECSKLFVPKSCGKCVDSVEVRIDSEDPYSKVGEIQAKGYSLMSGYYKNDEATKAAFTEDGWMRTGDLGLLDSKGNIFIKGRSKNMILSANGQNIYPEEIEAVVNNQPYVIESVVVDRGARLVALIYMDSEKAKAEGVDLEEYKKTIMAEVNKSMPSYSKITKVEVMDQPFEKTPKMSIKRFLYK